MRFWYDNEPDDKNHVKINAIRCSNCEKETGLSMDNLNSNYINIITSFVLNTLLHHAGMSWIIETREKLKYDMEKHNPDSITGGTWYNKYICKKIYGTVFEEFIINARNDRYNIICSIDAHEKYHP